MKLSTRNRIVYGAVTGGLLLAAAPAPAATLSQRLAKLERTHKADHKALLTTTADLRRARADVQSLQGRLSNDENAITAVGTLLLNCFQATSMSLDATTSVFTATPFITVSLNSTAAGPFYLATLNPACVGAITPAITPASARSSKRLFPIANLKFPKLP